MGARQWAAAIMIFGLFEIPALVDASAAPVSGQGTWESTLKARDIDGNPLASVLDPNAAFFFDTTLGLTWLRDWNMNGAMTWDTAVAWAAGLDVNGFAGWQLPWVTDTGVPGCTGTGYNGTDCGYNADTSGSPLAHMFHITLGNLSTYDTSGNLLPGTSGVDFGLVNTGPFRDVQNYYYYSGTSYIFPHSSAAWYYDISDGDQNYGSKGPPWTMYAVAIRVGDLSPRSIPVPPTHALLALGLVGLAASRRFRTA